MLGRTVLRTFGVVDLCVRESERSRAWLKIDHHTTLGLATAEDTGALVVKKIGPHDWPDGEVDLLGHLF